MIYDVLEAYHARWGLVAPISQWYDDLAEWMGGTQRWIVGKFPLALEDLAGDLKEWGLYPGD